MRGPRNLRGACLLGIFRRRQDSCNDLAARDHRQEDTPQKPAWLVTNALADGLSGRTGESLLGGRATEREFERIVRSTEARIRAYIAGMGVAVDEVDDVAQDVYVALYRSSATRPEGVELVRWLKGIARNLCMNHFRKQGRRAQRQREAIAELLAKTQGAFGKGEDTGDTQVALETCLKRLTTANRELLSLRYEQGLRSQAIAETQGKSPEAVRVRLHRIRARLKRCIVRSLSETA